VTAYVYSVNPTVLDGRFPAEDHALRQLIEGPDPEEPDRQDLRLETIEPLLDQMPPIDADVIWMAVVLKKRQIDIA
jgi:hypothetical protein